MKSGNGIDAISGQPTPFVRGAGPDAALIDGYRAAMPAREPEPEIAQGKDLAGKAKIVFAAGRGKTGKTTLLRWLTETSLLTQRSVILADIDPTHAALSQYFEGVSRPESDDPAGVRDWLLSLLDYAVSSRTSAIIDLGGGDTTLRGIVSELPGLCGEIEDAGLATVAFSLAGREPEDLVPALSLCDRGFSPTAQAIVFNEFAVPAGETRARAFARALGSEPYREVSGASALTLWMPRLFCAEAIEVRRAGFRLALDGRCDPALGMIDRTRLRTWLAAMDRRFSGVRSWLPGA